MSDGAEISRIHFPTIRLGSAHFDDVLEIKSEGAGEVVLQGGDADAFAIWYGGSLPIEIASPDEICLRWLNLAEKVFHGGDEFGAGDLEEQARGEIGLAAVSGFSANEMGGTIRGAHFQHSVEKVGVPSVTIFIGDETEGFADIFREPRLATGAGWDEGFVYSADDEVLARLVEEFQPALDVDHAVGGWLGGWRGQFGKEDLEPEGVVASDFLEDRCGRF